MKYSKFLQTVKRKNHVLPSSIERLQIIKKNGSQFVIDPETVEQDGVFKVSPLVFTDNQMYVVCPFCGQIHVHGGGDGHYSGSRTAHCKDMTGFYEIALIVA